MALIDVGSSAGLFYLAQSGGPPNMANQQWFWYRICSQGPEMPINTIGPPVIFQVDPGTMYVSYNNRSFGVEVEYLLTAAAGYVVLSQYLQITNATGSPIEFHLFRYSDFDLGGSFSGQIVQLGQNLRGLVNEATQTNAFSPSFSVDETVAGPGANHAEAGFFNTTLAKLNDSFPDNLNDNLGPVGPGDVTWAMQWDLTIPATNSVALAFDDYFVGPVPPVLAPIPDRTVSVGQLINLTNVAHGNYPPFHFYLGIGFGSSGPAGASVNSSNGVFQWTPSSTQAGTTNLIKIIVDDAYMPVGWATQSFTVMVKDYLQVSLGNTGLGAGETGSIPVTVLSTAPLTNLSFDITVPPDWLLSPGLSASAPSLGAANLTPVSSGAWQVALSANPGQNLQGTQVVANLTFTAVTGRPSTLVSLPTSNIAALKPGGALLADISGSLGRVAVLGTAPLVDVTTSPPGFVTLYLYGDSGAHYSIESRPDLTSASSWTEITQIVLPARSARAAVISSTNSSAFYRARKL